MMKQYKKELIVSTLLALLPIAAGLLPWNRQSMEFYHFCYHPYFL